MKAIETKYHGPTETRGSTVKASDKDGNSLTLHWDAALNSDQNHIQAARALCLKMGWKGEFVTGGIDNKGVHVFSEAAAQLDELQRMIMAAVHAGKTGGNPHMLSFVKLIKEQRPDL